MLERVAIVTGAARGIGAATARAAGRRRLRRRRRRPGRGRGARTRWTAIAATGGRALAVGADVADADAGGGRGRPGRRRARPADRPGQQRRRPPGQPAVQDDRRGLGHGPGRPPAGRVPDEPGRAEVHDRAAVGPHRQPLLHLGAGQPRPGQLRGGQGRHAGLHQDARDRAGPVRRHGERDRAGLHRDRHDRGHRGPGRRRLRRRSRRRRPTQIPVRRVGQPEDVAHVVSFLVSEGAGFVSGQVIYVAGGPRG